LAEARQLAEEELVMAEVAVVGQQERLAAWARGAWTKALLRSD
jgi:hypothetical protein